MEIDSLEFVKEQKIKHSNTSKNYINFKKRNIYQKINGRLNILYGIRGSGKTTLLFQKYLELKNCIFLNGEEIFLLKKNLSEILANIEYLFGENTNVFIDEINSIPNWKEIIKIYYDKFVKMNFYITGSNSLDIQDSKKILARRAQYFHISILNFREFIYLKYNISLKQFKIKDSLEKSAIHYEIYFKKMIEKIDVNLVDEYIENNLVYLFEKNKDTLKDLVEKSILDIGKTNNIQTNTLFKFERLILLLSISSQTNYENLAKDLEVSKSQIKEMLDTLEKTNIIKRIYPFKKGKSMVRKEWKYFFMIPSIRKMYAKSFLIPKEMIKGYMREDIFVANFDDVYYGAIDFIWNGYLIEIGSKNKDFKQFDKIKESKLKKVIVYDGLDISIRDDIIKIPFFIWYSII